MRSDTLPPPSPWVQHHLSMIPHGGLVLDLACGSGRHLQLLTDAGYATVGVDRDTRAANALANRPGLLLLEYDLEAEPWPFCAHEFCGIVVTNYLHRPLLPCLMDALRPGGILLYETFAVGNERCGRPRNPDFLLRPGELRAVFGMLETVAHEERTDTGPNPAVRQRIVSRKKKPA